jgi:hypothetical protein
VIGKKWPLAASFWPQENTITFYENLIVAIQKSSSNQQPEASSFFLGVRAVRGKKWPLAASLWPQENTITFYEI